VGKVQIDPEDPYVYTLDLKQHADLAANKDGGQDGGKDGSTTKSLLLKNFITLSVSVEIKESLILSVYSPYWMVNKTGETLQYCVRQAWAS